MQKSIKILLIILGIILIAGMTLGIIYRQNIFAEIGVGENCYLSPKPESQWSQTTIDSGGSFCIQAPTKEEINNFPSSEDQYTVSLPWTVNFESRDGEYINKLMLYFKQPIGGEREIIELHGRINNGNAQGTITKSLEFDRGSMFYLVAEIYNSAGHYIDKIDSNVLILFRGPNSGTVADDQIPHIPHQHNENAAPTVQLKNYSRFNLAEGGIGKIFQVIINVLLTFISVLAVGALIVGGYKYITSSGNAEAVATAKSTITWAIIGLVVAFAAYVIVDFIMLQLSG